MPTQFEILPELDLLFLRHEGNITAKEQRNLLRELSADPGYRDGLRVLIDTSAVTETDIGLASLLSRREIHQQRLLKITRETRWSYYAPTELAFGLSRRAQMMFEDLPNLKIGVFESSAEALSFLDLPADAIPGWPDA